jgi:hypothetical protein
MYNSKSVIPPLMTRGKNSQENSWAYVSANFIKIERISKVKQKVSKF